MLYRGREGKAHRVNYQGEEHAVRDMEGIYLETVRAEKLDVCPDDFGMAQKWGLSTFPAYFSYLIPSPPRLPYLPVFRFSLVSLLAQCGPFHVAFFFWRWLDPYPSRPPQTAHFQDA